MVKNCLVLMMVVLLAGPARAAAKESFSTTDPRSNLSTIFYAGVGGAVLGLSTLSFYGRPEKHLPNIAIGFAIGIICGASYVTIESAHRSSSASAPAKSNLVPAAEFELSMNSGRAVHSVVADLTPAQWSWSF